MNGQGEDAACQLGMQSPQSDSNITYHEPVVSVGVSLLKWCLQQACCALEETEGRISKAERDRDICVRKAGDLQQDIDALKDEKRRRSGIIARIETDMAKVRS